jgi:plastocyanin
VKAGQPWKRPSRLSIPDRSARAPGWTFTAGTYTFTVHNTGQFPHNLTVDGPGVQDKASPTMGGGGTGTVTVTLQKGSYELYCSVDGHKGQGMDMHIQVT